MQCLPKEVFSINILLTDLKLLGDGTFDSPGYCAFYCTYYVLDLETKKVLGLWVATKEMVILFFYFKGIKIFVKVSSSSMMEPLAAKTVILDLAHVIIFIFFQTIPFF